VRNGDVEISEVRKLVELVEKYDLDELSVQEADLSITVKGKGSGLAAPIVLDEEDHTELAAPTPHSLLLEGDIVDIVAPLVGVFFRSPTPDAAPFVEIGSVIEIGSEVGLIEAMKVFSPIPSEIAGEVVDIPAGNGMLVREGDVLVRVRRSEE